MRYPEILDALQRGEYAGLASEITATMNSFAEGRTKAIKAANEYAAKYAFAAQVVELYKNPGKKVKPDGGYLEGLAKEAAEALRSIEGELRAG